MDLLQQYLVGLLIVPDNENVLNSLVEQIFQNNLGSATLSDGRVIVPRQHFLHIIHNGESKSSAMNNLATLLEDGESVELLDGRVMNERELLLEALRLDNDHFQALFNLAKLLKSNEVIELSDGKKYNEKDLIKRILVDNPRDREACSMFVLLMDEEDETIELTRMKTAFTKKDLLVFRFSLQKPRLSDYLVLAQCLDRHDRVDSVYIWLDNVCQFKNGIHLTVKAMEMDLEDARPYIQLAILLRPDETILIKDFEKVDSKELLIRGLNCKTDTTWAHKQEQCDYDGMDEFAALKLAFRKYDMRNFGIYCLKKRLDFGESVTLRDGTFVCASAKRACVQED